MLRVDDRVEVRVDEANVQVMNKETGKNVAASLDGEWAKRHGIAGLIGASAVRWQTALQALSLNVGL